MITEGETKGTAEENAGFAIIFSRKFQNPGYLHFSSLFF